MVIGDIVIGIALNMEILNNQKRFCNKNKLESSIRSPITTTIVTATSTERHLIQQSSEESASIEVAAVMEMPRPNSGFQIK